MNFHAAAEELCPFLVQLHRPVYWSPSFHGSKLRWEASGGGPGDHLPAASLGRVPHGQAERLRDLRQIWQLHRAPGRPGSGWLQW